MLGEYLPVLLLLGLATAFAAGSLVVASLVGPDHPNPTKLAAYECGMEPLADVKGGQFAVKFYLVAMMFLIFDVEVVFLFPWAVVFQRLAWFGVIEMGVFIGLLFVAYIYIVRRGGLEWS
ncbi:MAG TPA: NADH-quinone oxidoreductase subunit A [Nitriliruptorales bacterium]|nr:NADH-quinone oxidoreductase subunit A [Nitriliruptorales bacterium]